MQRGKRDRENMTCMIFFVPYCIFFAVGFNGECYRRIFQVGNWFTYYFTVWSKPDENGESLLDKILKKIGRK